MCEFWKNEDELSTKIAIALPKIFRKNPRVGWIRADNAMSPEVAEELATLSSENRNLRIEKDQLTALIENKKPDLSVKLNDKQNIELSFLKQENLKIEFHNNQLPFSTVEYPQEIQFESVPEHLKTYLAPLTSNELENFNKSLPSNDDVDEYNWYREVYFRIKGTSVDLNISVENIGVSKANEIYIDIYFPKEVLVMDKYDIRYFKHPDSPIPENPVRKAEEKYKEEQKRKHFPFSAFSLGHGLDIPTYNNPLGSLQDSIANININKEISSEIIEEENKITIWVKSLLHTRKISINDFAMIPIKAGEFEIEMTVVCEEYSEINRITIPLKVNAESVNN